MKNELLFFRTYISDPYLYCAISDLHSVLFSLRIAAEVAATGRRAAMVFFLFFFLILIQLWLIVAAATICFNN